MTTTRGNGSIRSSEVASQALGTPLARAGVVIVVASIVGVQFIDVTLGSVGGFTLSAQKLAMAAALPLGVLLIGRLSLPREIVWPAITLSVTFAAASILGDSPNSALPSTLVSLLFSIAAMAALYTALVSPLASPKLLPRVWVAFAVGSAVITIAQFFGIAPLFNVPADVLHYRYTDGVIRGTGLKYDPNFQALILAIGVAFASVIEKRSWRFVSLLTLFGGILATQSRMGLLLALFAAVFNVGGGATAAFGAFRRIRAIGSLAGIGLLAWLVIPPAARASFLGRVADVVNAASLFLDPNSASWGGESTSGLQRSILLRASLNVAADGWPVGVGGGQVPAHIYSLTGDLNAAHNTYIELLCIGGVFALAFIALYATFTLKCIRRLGGRSSTEGRLGMNMVLVVACAAVFLTIAYATILWIPITLCAALAHRQSQIAETSPGALDSPPAELLSNAHRH